MCLLSFCKCLLLLTVWYFKCFQSNESFEAKGNTSDTHRLVTLCGYKRCCRDRETPGAQSGVTICGTLWMGGCWGRSTPDTPAHHFQPYLRAQCSAAGSRSACNMVSVPNKPMQSQIREPGDWSSHSNPKKVTWHHRELAVPVCTWI